MKYVKTSCLLLLFTVLFFYVLVNRSGAIFSGISAQLASNTSTTEQSEFYENAHICGSLPACFRISGALIGESIYKFSVALDKIFPLEDHPKIYDTQNHNLTKSTKKYLLISLSSIAYRYLMLLPLILLVLAVEGAYTIRLILLCLLYAPLIGWGKVSLDHVFDVRFNHYDYSAIAFLTLTLAKLIQRDQPLTLRQQIFICLFGQLCFENLGMVSALLLISHSLITSNQSTYGIKFRFGLTRLFNLGACCLAFAVLIVGIVCVKNGSLDQTLNQWVETSKFYRDLNFRLFYDSIFSSFAIFSKYPILFGLPAGVFVAVIGRMLGFIHPSKHLQRSLILTLSICTGYLFAFIIGFFNSGLHDEMGRQLICLSLNFTLANYLIGKLIGSRILNELQFVNNLE